MCALGRLLSDNLAISGRNANGFYGLDKEALTACF